MIRIGIIGYGYWGPNLVRNFAELSRAEVAAVSDLDAKKLETVKRRFPAVKTSTDFQDLLRDPAIDAIAIATPVSSHFELGMAALKAGKHVWLEKPMTETSLQARKLVDEADKRGLLLHVDHTFTYTGAVKKMGEINKEKKKAAAQKPDTPAKTVSTPKTKTPVIEHPPRSSSRQTPPQFSVSGSDKGMSFHPSRPPQDY